MNLKTGLSSGLCLILILSGISARAAESTQGEVFEAPRTGVVFTIPEEYQSLNGTIEYTDYGDNYSVGNGDVEVLATYYPYDARELDRRLEEEAEAEQRGDIETALKLFDELHGVSLFRIIGLDKERGADKLIEMYLSDLDPENAEASGISLSEEYLESEKEDILSRLYSEIGTCEGITYTFMTYDPEKLKSSEPFEGYEGGYYEEFISLTENADKVKESVKLTGGVEFTIPKELSEAGTGIHFETADLDGNSVDSSDLFAGHTITMINLWATWCGPCISELPDLEELNQEYLKKNCQIIGIVTDANKAEKITKAKEILAEKGVTYTNLASFDELSELLPQDVWPTSYFVDENGCLVGEPITGKKPDQYQKMLEELLQQK